MIQPEFLPYQGTDPYASDRRYLQVLSILHYVWGRMMLLFSCIAMIYILLGVMLATGAMPFPQPPGNDLKDKPDPG